MPTEIVHHLSPEEQELARKRQELATLQAELTDRELSLANLRAEIEAFEGRYLREVGVLYAELDDLNAKIAEFAAEAAGTEHARAAASEARAQADESYAAAHGEAAKAAEYSPSPEIDKLFREVAKHIHPDLADDEADHALRTRLMAEANLARERRDADALRKILDEYKSSPESVRGDGAAADLQRVLRQIERILRRLAEIEAEVARLTSSEIAMLMAKVQIAKSKGRYLIAEMRRDIQRKIDLARSEFETRFNEARSG
jgi:peptidoglycan hydrolase CwlO-like protein